MNTAQVTLRVPADLLLKMDSLAKRSNASRSEVFREAAEVLLERKASGSAHDKVRHLCGACGGPADASTSKAYLKTYGRD
jgi:metal-responsive CopG/Arc/MetJ family transcriptional regulator